MQPLLGAARDNETAKGVIELTGWLTGVAALVWEEDNFNAKRLAGWLIPPWSHQQLPAPPPTLGCRLKQLLALNSFAHDCRKVYPR